MRLLPFILLLAGCVTTTYQHGDITVTRSHLLTDEKTQFAFVRVPDGAVMVLGNASSVPDQAAISALSNVVFMAGVKSLVGMVMPLAPLLMGVP